MIRGQWRHVLAAAAFAMLHQAAEAAVPIVVGVVIDQAVAAGDVWALLWGVVGLALVYAALATAWVAAVRTDYQGLLAAAHQARMAAADRILDPAGGVGAVPPGALLSLATADARRVAGITQAVVIGAAALAALAVTAVVLLHISVALGLVILVGVMLVPLVVRLRARPLERRSFAEQHAAAQAVAVASDLVTGLRTLKGLGAEAAAAARYRHASQASLTATLRAVRARAGYDGFAVTLTGVVLAAVALVAGERATKGAISVGELVTAFGLTQFLIGPFARLAQVGSLVAQAKASADRVTTLLTARVAVPGGTLTLPQPVRGRVRLRRLTHAGLRSLELEAAPGELLGVAASDPADAAALLACLSLEVEPEAGAVEIDGTSLAALDPEGARAAVLVAAHDAHLFNETLFDNVAGGGGIGVQQVEAAMAAAAADEVAASLPAGADTVLTELGRSLSGGQHQRVALARALAADPPVLVLHDPTTAVDAATEHRISAGVRSLRAGRRTTLLVTTSPGLLAAADRVALIDDGGVVAEGSHTELARTQQRYRATVLT